MRNSNEIMSKKIKKSEKVVLNQMNCKESQYSKIKKQYGSFSLSFKEKKKVKEQTKMDIREENNCKSKCRMENMN